MRSAAGGTCGLLGRRLKVVFRPHTTSIVSSSVRKQWDAAPHVCSASTKTHWTPSTTSHGTLHISSLTPNSPNTSTPSPLTLLHIHGNSCTLSFHRLHTHSFPLTSHRTLLLDLPGHGASTNAPNPSASYTQPSHAAAALEALHTLGHLPPPTEDGDGGVVVLG
ncbi:hypothetical protein IWX92DRAFT_365593 [Phyllosticta citricarpa]